MQLGLFRKLASSPAFTLNPGEQRIWFAQMLRGVAVLCVVYFHLGQLFWSESKFVFAPDLLPPIHLTSRPLYLYATGWLGHNRIELGDYGVALFFLISGFVIPFSLFKMGNLRFFIRRCFRIYPTYIVGMTFTVLVMLLEAHLHQGSIPFGFAGYLVNATLLYDIFPYPTLDGINWTLIIEMRFYLLCMLVMALSSLRSPAALGVVGLALCGINLLFAYAADGLPRAHLLGLTGGIAHYSPYLIFMFVGVCFHHLFQGTWTLTLFGVMASLLLILFYVSCSTISSHQWMIRLIHAYTLALATFSLLYAFRARLKPHPVLNFFAEISFPLYVIHSFAGFALMNFLFSFQPYSLLVFLEAFIVMVFLAYLLHLYIEVPSNRLGHALTLKSA